LANLTPSSGTAAATPAHQAAAAARRAAQLQLPCPHLKQAVQQQQQQQQQQYGCGTCCRHRGGPQGGSSTCDCPAWLLQAEAVWCYATHAWLVRTQAMQFAAASRACSSSSSSSRGFLAPGDDATAVSTALPQSTPATAAGANGLVTLAKQHLQQLQQDRCYMHQQQLVEVQKYQAVAQEQLRGAAVALQSIWRGHAVRHQYQQLWQRQQKQSLTAAAATALQCMWRGVQARRAAAAARLQQQEQAARAAAVAAVRIQAAVRGHKVRQRLKAALAAARSIHGAAGSAAGPHRLNQHPQQQQQGAALGDQEARHAHQQQGIGPSQTGVGECGEEDWDFDGVPDDFVSLQAELLDDLLLPCTNPGAAESSAAAPALCPPMQQQQGVQQQCVGATASQIMTAAGLTGHGTTSSTSHAASSSDKAAGTAAGAVDGVAAAAAVVASGRHSDSSHCGNASGSAQLEAKITALMAEWGFTDRATAEAYYK
jgi:hypothetical protein